MNRTVEDAMQFTTSLKSFRYSMPQDRYDSIHERVKDLRRQISRENGLKFRVPGEVELSLQAERKLAELERIVENFLYA